MNKIITLMMMMVLSTALFAGIPHPVFVEYEEGTVVGSFQAYLGTDSGTTLTHESVGCGILGTYDLVMVECGNFPEWEYADVLYIVTDTQWTQVTLGYDNVQALTGVDAIWYDGTPGGEVTQQNEFATGWNLWSYNVQLADYHVEVVFADFIADSTLTKIKSITESYDPRIPDFNTLEEFVDGYGYWVQVTEDVSMELSGDPLPLATTPIAIAAGWNLVGYLPQETEAVTYAFAELIGNTIPATPPIYYNLTKVKSISQSYDPGLTSGFNTLDSLYAGNGYWVQLTTAVTNFIYPAPATTRAMKTETVEYIWTPVIYTNSTCAYARLATEGQVGAFVNGECRAVTEINDGCVSLVINGTEAETTTFKLYQNSQVTDLNTEITTAPGEDVFFEFTSEAPVATQMMRAYPNPFNPETTIAYQTSEAGNVNVSVYNVKGQKVSELTNENQSAGTHSVVWNAASQASGIYFVKMTASGTDQIQKLILMK